MSDLETFFELIYKKGNAEERVDDAVIRACGANPDQPDTWPFHDISYDPYDYSFELSGATIGWVPPDLSAFWALGFDRCWIRYENGMERSACTRYPTTLNPERPSSEHHRAIDERKIVQVKTIQYTLERCRQTLGKWRELQGHDQCWYYPDLFVNLCATLGIDHSLPSPDMPREEFEAGCQRFQDSLYGIRPS